jgi:hypothetical protein
MATKKTATKKVEITPTPAKDAPKPIAKKAAKKPAAKKTAAKKVVNPKPSLDLIARAAYLNYRRRVEQGLPGDSQGDWLEAERQMGLISAE